MPPETTQYRSGGTPGENYRASQPMTDQNRPNQVIDTRPETFHGSTQPEPSQEQSRQDKADQINAVKNKYNLVSVNEKWAQDNPMQVVKIGDYYYRAGISARDYDVVHMSSGDRAALLTKLLLQKGLTPEGAKGPGGGDINTSHVEVPFLPKPLPPGSPGEQATKVRKYAEELALPQPQRPYEVSEQAYRTIAISQEIARKSFKERLAWEQQLKETQPVLYQIYKEKGYSGYVEEIAKQIKDWDDYQAAVKALRPHYTPTGTPSEATREKGAPGTYDIIGAIKAGKISYVQKLFPDEVIQAARALIDAEEKAATTEALRYQGDKWWYQGRLVTDDERRRIIDDWDANTQPGILKGENPSNLMVKQQPALILAVDPQWQLLKDRPKDDPERKRYVEKYQQKLIDLANFVALAATPYTMGAIGSVGMKVVPAAVSGAMKAGSLVTTGSTILARAPIVSAVPRMAAQVIVGLGKLTAATAPSAYMAARVMDEGNASQLQDKWLQFNSLPVDKKEEYARAAGYTSYQYLTDAQKSVVLLHYAAPSKKALDAWLEGIGASAEKLNEVAAKGSQWLDKHAPVVIAKPVQVAEGVVLGVVEGAHYAAALPLMAASISDKAPRGDAGTFATQAALGMAGFFASLPAAIKKDPALQAGRIVGMFVLSPKALVKLGKGFGYTINPAKIKGFGKAISIEFSTTRVPRLGGATNAQMYQLGTSIVKQLAEGKIYASARIGDFVARVRNVPYQIVKPGRYWHFTSDFKPYEEAFKRGDTFKVEDKYLWFSPEAAKRFAIQPAFAKAGGKPGLIELVVDPQTQPNLAKLLRTGTAELQHAIRNKELILIKKTTEFDMQLGSYPRYQVTIKGDVISPTALKLTPQEVLKIQALVAKEAALDMALGWRGRFEAAKRMFAKPEQVKRIENSISQLQEMKKKGEFDVIDANDRIFKMRRHVPHPISGELKTRFKAVVRVPDTVAIVRDSKVIKVGQADEYLMLVKDRSAKAYDLPGGSADLSMQLTKEGKWRKYKPGELTGSEAVASQLKGETGLWLENRKFLGTYQGKVHSHSLAGARIYDGTATGTLDRMGAFRKFQESTFNYRNPEVSDIVLWDGKTRLPKRIEVMPSTYDIFKTDPRIRVSNLNLYKDDPALLITRDKGFAKRGGIDPPTEKMARTTASIEIKALRESLRPREPQLQDYLTAEPDWSNLSDLVMGKRRAVTVQKVKQIVKAVQRYRNTARTVSNKIPSIAEKLRVASEVEKPQYKSFLEQTQQKYINQMKLEDNIVREKVDYNKLSPEIKAKLDKELNLIKEAYGAGRSVAELTILNEFRRDIESLFVKDLKMESAGKSEGDISKAVEKQRAKLQRQLDEAYNYARRNYPHEYNRAYAFYMKAIVAGLNRYETPAERLEYARQVVEGKRSPVAEKLEHYRMPEPYKRYNQTDWDYLPRIVPPDTNKPPVYEPPLRPPIKTSTTPYIPPVVPSKTRQPPGQSQRIPPPPPKKRLDTPPFKPDIRIQNDSQKREFLERQNGVVTYQRGELQGKGRVWHVFYEPYGKDDRLILLGRPPIGARIATGPESAYKTAQLLSGRPPAEPFTEDTGAIDTVIVPTEKGIRTEFVQDKEVYRKGNVRIIQSDPEEPKNSRQKVAGIKRKARNSIRNLGAGVVETRSRRGLKRHLKLY